MNLACCPPVPPKVDERHRAAKLTFLADTVVGKQALHHHHHGGGYESIQIFASRLYHCQLSLEWTWMVEVGTGLMVASALGAPLPPSSSPSPIPSQKDMPLWEPLNLSSSMWRAWFAKVPRKEAASAMLLAASDPSDSIRRHTEGLLEAQLRRALLLSPSSSDEKEEAEGEEQLLTLAPIALAPLNPLFARAVRKILRLARVVWEV